METTEFDATLGGSEHLPTTVNSLKFAASRSVEIAAMTESFLKPCKAGLVFQSLPVHMRRRVMSHNSKRLPSKLRNAHLEQMKKSGPLLKHQKPSRKHRRRPKILLKDYNRRQLKNIWLETHIWHAKRFHMTNRWGHRIAEAPCDKVFRACYRATSKHCLLQDISYYTPIQIIGDIDLIKDMLSVITHSSVGPTVTAKAYISGTRQGAIHIYEPNKFPYNYIGKATFLWEPCEKSNRTLWLFVHPSQSKQVEQCFNNLQCTVKKDIEIEVNAKRQKISNIYAESIKIKHLPESFNCFRLTGPNSHAILVKSLKCVENLDHIKNNNWVDQYTKNNSNLSLKVKSEYWKSISPTQTPAQLPPRIIVSLIVRDPRLMRPTYRTKAIPDDSYTQLSREALTQVPPTVSTSPLWSTDIHQELKQNVKTNGEFIKHVTNLKLVPGEVYENDPELQSVPVTLIQRPGSKDSCYKKLGYGCGWDIVVPSGYGLPFWQTFIMFGARAGGLRETESLALEMGECYLPPDSDAGKANDERIELELKERYFKLPPKKRENYIKMGINSPFRCPWILLLRGWTDKPVDDFYVLRDGKILEDLQSCLKKKVRPSNLQQIDMTDSCLVAVYLNIPAGNLQKNALICLPKSGDIQNVKMLFEPPHKDPNESLRRETRAEHAKTLKKIRKLRVKQKKKKLQPTLLLPKKHEKKPKVKLNHEPSEYMKRMRELWLPSNIDAVRHVCSRDTMGFVAQGAFSFTEAHSCGIGYIALNALRKFITIGQSQVLVRNPSSNKYNVAKFEIIKYV